MSLSRIAGPSALLATLLLPGCFTASVLDSGAGTDAKFEGPIAAGSGRDAGLSLAGACCAPVVLPVALFAGAVALDVATFPIQVGFGFYPYGERGEPGSPLRW